MKTPAKVSYLSFCFSQATGKWLLTLDVSESGEREGDHSGEISSPRKEMQQPVIKGSHQRTSFVCGYRKLWEIVGCAKGWGRRGVVSALWIETSTEEEDQGKHKIVHSMVDKPIIDVY